MSVGRSGQEVYDPQDSRSSYLLDSTLSELALSSQQSSSAAAWSWFTTPGGGTGDELVTPPPLPEGTIPNVRKITYYTQPNTFYLVMYHDELGIDI